jgi:hypothetical protein
MNERLREFQSTLESLGRQRNFLKNREVRSILSGVQKPVREIPHNVENVSNMKLYCVNVRNFTGTALRKTLKRLSYTKFLYKENFVQFWASLRFLQIVEPNLRPMCYMILRNAWSQEWQLLYQECLDLLSDYGELERFSVKKEDADKYRDIMLVLEGLDQEYWIPVSVFPRYTYIKEPKMHYAFVPKDKYLGRESEFRSCVKEYLRSLDIKTLFIPPPDLTLRVGSARYNDGGKVKADYEKPEISFESGFLYQRFNPKPLGTREVWLPDKATKINNSFWMIIGRQILQSDPTFPDKDPMVTWERIREDLRKPFASFDISGYGFQYIREWLFVVADEIARLFPNPDIFEQCGIFKYLFKNTKVQMEDGTFVYPPRGVGLGYYEDLKTIGVNAILHGLNPISVYGDQGILPKSSIMLGVQRLRYYGFELPTKKVNFNQLEIKWSGWTMSHRSCRRSKQLFDPLISLFSAQYHWERKSILMSFASENPEYYKSKNRIIPFEYEITFGHEFTKSDSLWNFHNGGVSDSSPVNTGDLRSWAVQRMKSPQDVVVDSFLYESPFFTSWKRADAKKFSIQRKRTYQNSIPCNTAIFDYAHPVLKLNKTRKPDLPKLAALISDATEHKLVINYQLTSGKFLFGLSGNGAASALRLCNRYRNPWEAYATGGYKVETLWRGGPLPSSEQLFLLERFRTDIDKINGFIEPRFDVDSYNYAQLFPHTRPTKRDCGDVSRNMTKRQTTDASQKEKFRISMNDIVELNSLESRRDDSIMGKRVLDFFSDIDSRMTNTGVVEVPDDSGDDDDLFLEEYD